MWFLQEHTKNHADGSPHGGPTKTHHAKGLIPPWRLPSLLERHITRVSMCVSVASLSYSTTGRLGRPDYRRVLDFHVDSGRVGTSNDWTKRCVYFAAA